MKTETLVLCSGLGIASFALLLLIISVATPNWTDDGQGNQVGLFKSCWNMTCNTDNKVTQGGLSVVSILLLFFGIFTGVAANFLESIAILPLVTTGFLFFSSMFLMSAYATWGVASRDPSYNNNGLVSSSSSSCIAMSWSYNLAVASHFFLIIALTLVGMFAGNKFIGS
ncbi:unnamed protein product, partial [Didymodactylos carnosus]